MRRHRITTQLWTMAFRNLGRRPRRSLLSMVAIGLAAFTMTVLLSLIAGLKADMASNIQRYTTGQVLIENRGLARAGALALSYALQPVTDLRQRLANQPGVAAVSPRIAGGGSVFVDGDAVFFPLLGLDFSSDPMHLVDFLVAGGRLPTAGQREALVSSGLADKLHLKAGDSLTVVSPTVRGSSNGMTFTVTGVVQPALGTYQTPWLFTSFETAGRLVKLTDGATSLVITSPPGTDPQTLARRLQALVDDPSLVCRAWFETSSTYGLMDLAGILYGFIGLIFCALASTVVINTMLMVVLERSKEIGMLGALGMDSRDIRSLFLAESAVLSGLGALGGVVLGSVVSVVLGITGLDYGEAMKGVNLGVSSVLRPLWEPQTPILVLFLASGVALAFTLIPVGRLRKMIIVDALRGDI